MNRAEVQFLLRKYGVRPRREQGQHFLIDERVIPRMIAEANITHDDVVLEIGPGLGVLSIPLAEHARRVIAIEQDRKLCAALTVLAEQFPELEPHCEDIRTANLASYGLKDRQYLLVANLPYQITSWVLRHFLECPPTPRRMIIMVQEEVAERVVAPPREMSILSVAVQCLADAEMVQRVPRSCFFPIPEVDSAVLTIIPKEKPLSSDVHAFMQLVSIGFSSRRKQLQNNLQAGFHLKPAEAKALLQSIGLSSTVRPQDLSVADWERLRGEISDPRLLQSRGA